MQQPDELEQKLAKGRSWMPGQAPLIFLVVLLLLLVPGLVRIVWPFLTSFILAAILAIVASPANQWLIRRIRKPALATVLTTVTTTLLVGAVVVGAGFALTRELGVIYDELSRRSLTEGGWPALAAHTADQVVNALATFVPLDTDAIRTYLLDGMGAAAGYLVNSFGAAAGGLTNALITGLLTTIFLYFVLRHGCDWIGHIARLTPLDMRTSANLVKTVRDSVMANVTGVAAVMLGQALLLGLGFWAAGVRSPALWGAIGGLASVLPVVGALLVWVPIVVAFAFMGAYWKALLLLLWGSLVVGSADNVIRAVVVGTRERQHPVIIALAAVGGIYAFGMLGLLLGPLLVSLAAAVLKEIRELLPPCAGREEEVSAGPIPRSEKWPRPQRWLACLWPGPPRSASPCSTETPPDRPTG